MVFIELGYVHQLHYLSYFRTYIALLLLYFMTYLRHVVPFRIRHHFIRILEIDDVRVCRDIYMSGRHVMSFTPVSLWRTTFLRPGAGSTSPRCDPCSNRHRGNPFLHWPISRIIWWYNNIQYNKILTWFMLFGLPIFGITNVRDSDFRGNDFRDIDFRDIDFRDNDFRD